MSIIKRLIKFSLKLFKKKRKTSRKKSKQRKNRKASTLQRKKVKAGLKRRIRPVSKPSREKAKPKRIVLKKNKPPKLLPKQKISVIKQGKKASLKALPKVNEDFIGDVTHFFGKIQVVVLKVTKGVLFVNDQIHVKGKSTDFHQKVQSLQIESVDVKLAKPGQLVGLKVDKPAQVGDKIFKVQKPSRRL